MKTYLLLCSILAYTSAQTTDQETTTYSPESTTETDDVVGFQRDLNLVSYIQNFKQIMAQYVNAQYRNLTVAEMDKVKLTLEEFLHNFATDLRDTIHDKHEDKLEVEHDETFTEIKKKIILEFPEVTEDVANRIIVKLKKNLYSTRNKLDEIIRDSYKAQIENSN